MAAAGLLSAYAFFVLYRYGAFAGYMDHGEPNVAIRSWRLATGQDIYVPPSIRLLPDGPLWARDLHDQRPLPGLVRRFHFYL